MINACKSRQALLGKLATILGLIATIISVSSCTHTTDRSKGAQADPNLIPRQTFFENPTRRAPTLSPDGKWLAYLAESDGVVNIWIAPRGQLDKAKPLTSDRNRGIHSYFWTMNSQYILYSQDQDGDENFHVYAVELATGKVKDLTPFENVAAYVTQLSEKLPEEVLIAINDRDPRFHDLYRVHIPSGKHSLVVKNEQGFLGFIADDNLTVRLAMRSRPDAGMDMLLAGPDRKWQDFISVPMEDAMTTAPIGLDDSGKILYAVDSRGRNTAALVQFNLQDRSQKVLAENPKADATGYIYHVKEGKIQAVAFEYERQEWVILDKSIEADFAYLKTVAEGDIILNSRTLDDKSWVLAYIPADGPVSYYIYDRPQKKAEFLFTNRPSFEKLKLAKMYPVEIKARDGLPLVSYLSLPPSADQAAKARPRRPLPMVLLVHGGPWARDSWGLNSYHQWLASRGYAVLSVNFRGSTGFGKNFLNAGNLEWAGKMHDDLIDAVNWAIAEKIADQDRIAIMGGSYGGYAALVGLTYTPDTFACAVDIVGPSNLETLLNSIPPYWEPMIEQMTSRIGDHRTEEGRKLLAERSPLHRADKIQKPLLIAQGANDPRVKQAESDQIVQAMKEKNIPVTYVLYPDEGHGFVKPANRISFHAVAEVFLASCLNAPYEPFGDDLKGSSMQVPTGAEHISGLEKALKAMSK